MHPRYRQFGFKDEDGAEVGAFVRHARELGLSRNQIDALFEMNRTLPKDDPVAAEAAAQSFYARYQFPQNIRDGLEQWFNSPTVSAPVPDRGALAKELAELREKIRNDPDSYDRDPWLAERHHDLIEQLGSPAAGSPPGDGAGAGAADVVAGDVGAPAAGSPSNP